MDKKKVIFILGIGRSGSTLLDLMLGSHPQAFSLGEISKLPQKLVNKGQRNLAALKESRFWIDNFDEAELKRFAAGISNHRFNKYIPLKIERFVRELVGKDDIFNPYTILFEKTKTQILVDSSKYFSWVSQQLKNREFQKGVIDSYLIRMVRDGRAVVNSYSRIYPEQTISEITQKWVRLFKEQQDFYDKFSGGQKMLVRYEELATKPEEVLTNICQFLGIEFFPDMVEFWKHEHHHITGSRGTNALIRKYRGLKQKKGMEEIHGSYYEQMGLQIKLDLRWKNELSVDNLAIFNSFAGELNKPYQWNIE
ncbi:MAG: sulfotransferase [Okeania sp. SIO3I5]|uniref:sulfotransferase family protein n=1 Tax=Okeania sp. SIO3I5 TaxID=2607805 RepID=UPI0013BCA9A4|nr:sulfotransferase [Okeania sp. SIO3I5]NEQ36338.1 sulfotransferase [Okeania sp. SIO3I5]